MKENVIPQINQDIDPKLLVHVLGKNLVWVLFLFVIAITSAFLLIRYTKPIYKSKAVIQLTSEKVENNVLDEKLNPYNSENIAKEIELLKSPVFLSRVTQKIPLDVSYYVKGAILNFENYKATPFVVEYDSISDYNYGKRIDVKFIDAENFKITSTETASPIDGTHKLGEWIDAGDSKFKLVRNFNKPLKLDEDYYFTFNDPKNFISDITGTLEVNILSEQAKTIEIAYTGYNANKVSDVVNSIATEFEFFNLEKKQESANKVLEYINRTLGIVSDSLTANENALSKYGDNTIGDLSRFEYQQSKIFDQKMINQEREFVIKNDIETLKKIRNIPINSKSDVVNILAIISGTSLQTSLTGNLERFNVLFNNYDDLSYSSPSESPALRKVNYQIEQQKRNWEGALQTLEGVLNDRLAFQSTINFNDIATAGSPHSVDSISISAAMQKRIKEVNEKFFNQLIEKKAEYSIAKEGFTPEYQILEFASVVEKPIAPDRRVIILTALAAWLLLSVLLVGVRYVLTDEILLINDISKYTEAPILGMIHKYKEDIPVSQLVVDKKPKGLIAEAFRTARTNLQFIYNEPGPKVISLTSTISGEGKTFVSINLAGILAFSGSKVIVIDCDMRKPKIHLGFETDNDLGMSTILINQTSVSECIKHSKMENLHFITAGPIPPNPAELLLTNKMEQVIQELKAIYDFVVIDNPPVGLVSDAVVNLQRADYPIYIFRSDYSRKFFINNLNRLRIENKITRLSCILNSVDINKNKGYGYGYGYGSYNYGYGYGYGFGYYDEESGLVDNAEKTKTKFFSLLKGKKS